jgi:hypothetical protein
VAREEPAGGGVLPLSCRASVETSALLVTAPPLSAAELQEVTREISRATSWRLSPAELNAEIAAFSGTFEESLRAVSGPA